jgi:uncharacterized protein (TIGR03083 family)
MAGACARRKGVTVTTGTGEPVVVVLDEQWQALEGLGRDLTDAEWDLPSECPGWTVRDVLSHLIGIERSLLGDPSPAPLDELPSHVANEIGARNEAWVVARRDLPGRAVLDEFRDVTARRLEDLRASPSARFDEIGPSPVGLVPYREFMRVRVMDCWVHEQDMRVATGRPGHESGPAAQLSLERLTSAMPFVVGKQAGAPEGSSVRFELRGAMPRRIDVVVRDGRASTVAELEGEPTAVLDMGVEAFWRLTCGRVDGQSARVAGLVVVDGEIELAYRVLDAMAFMI